MLACASPPRWLDQVLVDVDTLLLDHAHCEKKAASTVLAFVYRAPDPVLAPPLSRMAREELRHFEMALRQLKRRGVRFDRLEPAAYAAKLSEGARGLRDAFVIAALIEARSCERIALLAASIPDEALRGFYRRLHPAEERHAALMLDAAARFGEVPDRLAYFAAREAELIATGEPTVRMHS